MKSDEKYDLGAPWGAVDAHSNTVDFDVFGRIMSNYVAEHYVAKVAVVEIEKAPKNYKAA